MSEGSFLKKLQTRWGVSGPFQVILILLSFSIAGSSLLKVMVFVRGLLGIDDASPLWLRILVYVILAMPTYQILLLAAGTLLGQFKFFWRFQKKMMSRFRFLTPGYWANRSKKGKTPAQLKEAEIEDAEIVSAP